MSRCEWLESLRTVLVDFLPLSLVSIICQYATRSITRETVLAWLRLRDSFSPLNAQIVMTSGSNCSLHFYLADNYVWVMAPFAHFLTPMFIEDVLNFVHMRPSPIDAWFVGENENDAIPMREQLVCRLDDL